MRLDATSPVTQLTTSPEPRQPGAFAIHPRHQALTVKFGQATFDAEGQEAKSHLFSRRIHWPGGASGVTIGRGYDMGRRTAIQIQSELIRAGLPAEKAIWFSRASGLRGESANRFVDAHNESAPILPIEVQQHLFEEVTTPEIISDIKRIISKPDVQRAYGVASWESIDATIKEILFDLRYRGDYTPETRKRIQPLVVQGDRDGLAELMKDTEYWASLGVPLDRINRRIEISR